MLSERNTRMGGTKAERRWRTLQAALSLAAALLVTRSSAQPGEVSLMTVLGVVPRAGQCGPTVQVPACVLAA